MVIPAIFGLVQGFRFPIGDRPDMSASCSSSRQIKALNRSIVNAGNTDS